MVEKLGKDWYVDGNKFSCVFKDFQAMIYQYTGPQEGKPIVAVLVKQDKKYYCYFKTYMEAFKFVNTFDNTYQANKDFNDQFIKASEKLK